jgi:hypothetical protein
MEKESVEELRQPCYLCEKSTPVRDLTVTWRNSPGICPSCRWKLEEAQLRKFEGMYFPCEDYEASSG